MPKPPLLVAPVPNEPIASATWGDPVTDAVNGLVTGASWIGAIIAAAGTNQTLPTSSSPLTFPTPIFDSDGFAQVSSNRFVIPPGLDGLYFINVGMNTDTFDGGKGMRLSIDKNGTRQLQAQGASYSGTGHAITITTILPLIAGDIIASTISGNHTVTVKVVNKYYSLRRVGDIPASYSEEAAYPEGV